jgi:DNA-binding ferritin-like protein
MKIDRVFFQGKYSIFSQFLDTTLQAEGILEEGETMEEGINQIRNRLNNLADSYRGINYMAPPKDSYDGTKLSSSIKDEPLQYPAPPTVINLADEKLEIAIDNCTDVTHLASLKAQCTTPQLIKQYMDKLKELSK